MRTQQVECFVFRQNKGHFEFLLLKRIPAKGSFWQPPCGGVEKGEDLLSASYREIEEETSIKKEDIIKVISDVHTFVMDKHYLTGEPMTPITEYVFGFEVSENTQISIEENIYPEHEEYRWVSFEEALHLLKWDNNKEGLQALQQKLILQ
jgi:8-oxo-dGTP pyrophosphatase MutT (NUDIX family)